MTGAPMARDRSSYLRKLLWLAAFSSAFLICGWSVYWQVARNLAERELSNEIEREARFGRVWTCSKLEFRGYPLSITVDCAGPNLRVDDDLISAKRALITARLYAPTLVDIDVSGPAEFRSETTQGSFDWKSLQVSTRGLPRRLDRLSVIGQELTTRLPESAPTKIKTVHLHLRRTSPIQMAPYSLVVGLAGIDWEPLTQVIGRGNPALFTALGAVTQLDAANEGTWQERAERWSGAGGRVSITALDLTRDDFVLHAEGAAGIDRRHRPDGKLAMRVRNAGPALMALAESLGAFRRGTLAGQLALGLLNRPGELKFDVIAENGTLSAGPLRRVLTLPPLY